jgi:hypothetical protein
MKSSSLACKDQLRRHFGAAFVIVTLLAVVCGSASAQPVTVNATITVLPASTPPPPPAVCGPPASGYKICVTPEPISTPNVPTGTDVAIVWNLTTSGWSFVKNKGIDIKNKKDWKPKEDSPTQYTATNKKETGTVPYKYEINVTDGTTPLPGWDPTIMN